MDCPKFVPNIFNNSKCSQCFKALENHSQSRVKSSSNTIQDHLPLNVLKCGHLFIAPPDFLPRDHHFRNKRWQRRWFILYENGTLKYSIDDHPEAIPQGYIDLNQLIELGEGDEITSHPHSVILKFNDSTFFLKGSSGEECRKWTHLLTKFCPNAASISSGVRRLSNFCDITTEKPITDESPTDKGVVRKGMDEWSKEEGLPTLLRSYVSAYESKSIKLAENEVTGNMDSLRIQPIHQIVHNSNTHLLRGDPDGGEQLLVADRHVSAQPQPPVSAEEISSNLKTLKSCLNSKKLELQELSQDSGLAPDKLVLENFKLQLNSYFLEIDKVSYLVNYRERDLKECLAQKEQEVAHLRSALGSTIDNHILQDENKLLVERINDVTEKYYNLDKNHKILKSKLHRYRTNSLKNVDLENEVTIKLAKLESRLNQYLPSEEELPQQPVAPTNEKPTLLNVVFKLNALEQRLEAGGPPTEWYKCDNCSYLNDEIQERDCKLNELETMVNHLESNVAYINTLKVKHEKEVGELTKISSEALRALESSYSRLVRELEQKHAGTLKEFEIQKEKEFHEETRATKNALELLKNNYELELQTEIEELRKEFLIKYKEQNAMLQKMHLEHEDETNQLRALLNELTQKYAEKCLETAHLEEALRRRN